MYHDETDNYIRFLWFIVLNTHCSCISSSYGEDKKLSNVLGIYLLDKHFSSRQIAALTLTYLTHSAGFTIAWIEYVMSFKPIVMMRRMMWMFVSYRMRMALMVEEMRMLVICIRVVVACHGP